MGKSGALSSARGGPVRRVIITAGGTGGHVFPALAAAELFRQQGIEVLWLGTRKGIEASVVPANEFPIRYLDVAGVRGQGLKRLLAAPMKIGLSVWEVIKTVRTFKPDLALGMGGFVTGPVGIGVWLSRRPVFIHEQNAIAGFTNKQLARLARRVFQAFPGAFPDSDPKVETTGNPVRQTIVAIEEPATRYRQHSGPVRLLILGGSQGAVALNETVPQALALLAEGPELLVRHQAGARNEAAARAHYEQSGVAASVEPFIQDMAEAYAWADLVICRSGALTVSELAAAGVASLLIPYPHAVDDHQTLNGSYLSKAGAAILVQQQDATAESLAATLAGLIRDRETLQSMGEKARLLAMTNATERLVSRCMELAGG